MLITSQKIGRSVLMVGRIKYYEHEKDFVTRGGYSFIASNILFLGKRGDHVIES